MIGTRRFFDLVARCDDLLENAGIGSVVLPDVMIFLIRGDDLLELDHRRWLFSVEAVLFDAQGSWMLLLLLV